MFKENSRFLEVTSTIYGNKTWSFHLERVSNDKFVLKSKKDHIKLAKALLSWYDSNEKLSSQEYTEVLTYMKSNPSPLLVENAGKSFPR